MPDSTRRGRLGACQGRTEASVEALRDGREPDGHRGARGVLTHPSSQSPYTPAPSSPSPSKSVRRSALRPTVSTSTCSSVRPLASVGSSAASVRPRVGESVRQRPARTRAGPVGGVEPRPLPRRTSRTKRGCAANRSDSCSPDSVVPRRQVVDLRPGALGFTWSGVTGETPPHARGEQRRDRDGSQRFGRAWRVTDGPQDTRAGGCAVARYSSTPRSGSLRIAVSSLARKFWTITSWTDPYVRAMRRSAKRASPCSDTVSPIPTRMPVVNGMPAASSSTRRRSAGSLSAA